MSLLSCSVTVGVTRALHLTPLIHSVYGWCPHYLVSSFYVLRGQSSNNTCSIKITLMKQAGKNHKAVLYTANVAGALTSLDPFSFLCIYEIGVETCCKPCTWHRLGLVFLAPILFSVVAGWSQTAFGGSGWFLSIKLLQKDENHSTCPSCIMHNSFGLPYTPAL